MEPGALFCLWGAEFKSSAHAGELSPPCRGVWVLAARGAGASHMAARPGSCWQKTAAASPEHLHVQFHNRIKAAVLERRDGSVGQVYTGAYTEGIEVYFLTLLRLTCGAVQMCLCKETPSGKVGGGSGTRR